MNSLYQCLNWEYALSCKLPTYGAVRRFRLMYNYRVSNILLIRETPSPGNSISFQTQPGTP